MLKRPLALLVIVAAGRLAHAAPPPAVIGDAVVPEPARLLDDGSAYLDVVRPGSGRGLGEKGMSILAKAGVDASAPIWVVHFDPKAAGREPLLYVFKETDGAMVDRVAQSMGLAVRRVGKLVAAARQPILDAVPDAMVHELAARPLPARPRVRVYVPTVLRIFEPEIEKAEKDPRPRHAAVRVRREQSPRRLPRPHLGAGGDGPRHRQREVEVRAKLGSVTIRRG